MSSSSSPSDPPSCKPPDGASCWLCLEEGPDDSGAPLVRDCSCRGHSGFAHVPCLIKYAESKCRDYIDRPPDFAAYKIFGECPNCKQEYQGAISYEMTKAQLSFVEREKVHSWHILALLKRINVLDGKKEADRIEGEEISAKMLMLLEDDSSLDDVMSIIIVHQYIGRFYKNVGTTQSLEKAKYYYEKARDVSNTSSGDVVSVQLLDNELAEVKARLNGHSLPKTQEKDLSSLRARYNFMVQHGEHEIKTTQMGVELATALFRTYHTIEALRLLERLVINSRRVHGSEHNETKKADRWWQRLKLRCVFIENRPFIDPNDRYQVLRYEQDGNSYIVKGPLLTNYMEEPRNVDGEMTFSVPSTDVGISFSRGTPLMLHGLKKAAHLNGEIGDVRDYCKLSHRFVVYLEGKGLNPVKVKHQNVRIVFDLPIPKPKNLD